MGVCFGLSIQCVSTAKACFNPAGPVHMPAHTHSLSYSLLVYQTLRRVLVLMALINLWC